MREQNAIDVVIRHFNPTCNNHERERVNQDDDSDDWDEEDLALLNCEDPDLKNAERERIGQLKRMMDQTVKQVSEVIFLFFLFFVSFCFFKIKKK